MKVTMEVDCTPEEARRFLGLPDLTPVHDEYVRRMQEAAAAAMDNMDPQALAQFWGPVAGQAVEQMQKAMWSMMGAATGPAPDEDEG